MPGSPVPGDRRPVPAGWPGTPVSPSSSGYASPHSIWFRNSVRGAVGLAGAVLVAHVAHLHNAFWVVLATLAVLRSNALGTSSTVIREVAGTVVGVVVGALLIIAIGPHQAVLWVVLPVAAFLAGYAPGGMSFGAGQAAFSLLVLILFNLIMPVGWQVGFIRIEDVLVGCAISLVTGLLLWPRGAIALLTQNLSAAYARGIDYVSESIECCLAAYMTPPGPTGRSAVRTPNAQPARAAGDQLDDAFRHYLAERHARPTTVANLAALVTGAARVRLAGQSLARLANAGEQRGRAVVAGDGSLLEPDARALNSWYHALGRALVGDTTVPAPDPRDPDDHTRVLWCLRQAARGELDGLDGLDGAGNEVAIRPGLRLLWAHQQMDELWDLEGRLADPAARVVEESRRLRVRRHQPESPGPPPRESG